MILFATNLAAQDSRINLFCKRSLSGIVIHLQLGKMLLWKCLLGSVNKHVPKDFFSINWQWIRFNHIQNETHTRRFSPYLVMTWMAFSWKKKLPCIYYLLQFSIHPISVFPTVSKNMEVWLEVEIEISKVIFHKHQFISIVPNW